MSPATARILVADTLTLALSDAPAGIVGWSSDAPMVATVDAGGRVTAVSAGVATIEAHLTGDAVLASTITVRSRPATVDGCQGANPLDPRSFPACPGGGGIFGGWTVDELGLPAFALTLDPRTDPLAVWPTSEAIFPVNRVRTERFVVLGNDRVNFMPTDEGTVSLFGDERGPTWMNRVWEPQRNLGGGFSFVRDGAQGGGETWSSGWKWAPPGAIGTRSFGAGYFRAETSHEGISVRHTVWAPAGDAPLLIDEVLIENHGDGPRAIEHWEYWDVNRHQLVSSWARTGLAAPPSDAARDDLNGRFLQEVAFDETRLVLRASMTPKLGQTPSAPGAVDGVDWYPPDVFLAQLDGIAPDDVAGDQDEFFGAGTVSAPETVAAQLPGMLLPPVDGFGQRACLAMRHDLSLAAGESRTLRFAYGYLPEGHDLSIAAAHAGATLAESAEQWKKKWVIADVPGLPVMHRETAWRSGLLAGSTLRHDYYGERYTPQGSAYLYLHGVDGAPRDQALFAAATTWTDPALARGNLRLIMKVTGGADGEITYAFSGHGVNEGATIHEHPSDLDIFLMFGLAEYLGATGDRAFLEEEVDFHPRGSASGSVLEHIRVAFHHLRDSVGVGPHGLIRIQDGDWSDGIVYEDLSPLAITNTIANGESIPNTQMALHVLPLLAAQIEGLDAGLATEMRAFAATLQTPAAEAFGTRWFGRAWLRNTLDQEYLKGNDFAADPFNATLIDLEAQPWGLLAEGLLDDAQRETLLDEIDVRLSSPIGPSMRAGGPVWPAISQLMTWAWARHRPARAWESLEKQSYARHAALFPEQWMGIWSGPDGFEPSGGTWASPVTPMTDFPVANMNSEAMWVLGLLRTAGVEPTADGFRVTPSPARDEYAIDLPLLSLEVLPNHVGLVYRPKTDGSLVVRVVTPAGEVATPISFHAGDEVPISVPR